MSKVIKLQRNKVDLTIMERLSMLQFLPPSGTVLEMHDIRNITKAIEMDEVEQEALSANAKENQGRIALDPGENTESEREFTPQQFVFIGDLLKQLDKDGKVTMNILDLFDKFLPKDPPEAPLELPENKE